MDKKGKYFVLEGGDGSGKGTQLALLQRWLEELGKDFIVTKEPGGTPIGERIRELLLSHSGVALVPTAELMLFSADRSQIITELIKPALEAGKIILSDRSFLSTLAFQGYGRGLNIDVIRHLCTVAMQGILPNKIFYLDIDPYIARARIQKRKGQEMDRIDSESIDFHYRVRNGYLTEACLYPGLIEIVSAVGNIKEVHHELLRKFIVCLEQN